MLASKQIIGVVETKGCADRGTGSLKPPAACTGEGTPQDLGAVTEANAARLRIAVARLSRRLRPTTAAGALTATEVDVLVAAERRGPIRLSDLASFAGLNPTMLSRLIPKLEQAGLIRRLADDSDRRVCRVESTITGSDLIARIRSARNDVLLTQISQLDRSRQEAIALALPVLEKLAESLPAGVRPRPVGHRR